jgi:hypothetical protein
VMIWSRESGLAAEGCEVSLVDGGRRLVFSADGFISVA